MISEVGQESRRLNAQLVQQRAIAIGKDSRIAFLTQDLEQLRRRCCRAGYEDTARLRGKLEQLGARLAGLEAQRRLPGCASRPRRRAQCLPGGCAKPRCVRGGTSGNYLRKPKSRSISRKRQSRNASAACRTSSSYRDVVEAGGHFAHHDGGLETNGGARLGARRAADLVILPDRLHQPPTRIGG